MLLAALIARTAPAACTKPDQQIEVQRQQRIEGQVQAGVLAFRAAASGESENQSVWQAQLPSQDLVDQQWKLYMLCQAKERGDIDPVTHCKLVRAVLGELSGVDLQADTCTAVPAPGASASPDGSTGSSAPCSPLRPLDDVQMPFKGYLAQDALILWDRATADGYFDHRKGGSHVVKIASDGDLHVDDDDVRSLDMRADLSSFTLPTIDVEGWRVEHSLAQPQLTNGRGTRLDIGELAGDSVFDAYLLPGAPAKLLTVDQRGRDQVAVRTWVVEASCLPR